MALITPNLISSLKSHIKHFQYASNPLLWVSDRTDSHLWSTQQCIIESVRDNRRTAVHSCHSSGKSFIAAHIVAWWIESHPPGEAFVVTSAHTGSQVRAILWREISRVHAMGMIGRINQTEWWIDVKDKTGSHEEMVAFGRKPDDLDPTGFQGIHARYVLVIFDEACGMPELLFDAADTLITNEDSRFLAIGNPDDPMSEFAEVCKPGSGWNVIGISAFDTPAFTGEPVPERLKTNLISKLWVEEKTKKWVGDLCGKCGTKIDLLSIRSITPKCVSCDAPISPTSIYISKVLGQFPESSEDGLIPLSWIRAAQERTLKPSDPNCLGVDVGAGGDKSTVAHRRGPVVRIIRRDQNPDTMATCGNVVSDLKRTGANVAKVDQIGIGRGLVDRGKELKRNREISQTFVGINVGEAARLSEEFTRLRSEAWWNLRERFEEGDIDIDPNDDDLAGQLSSIKFRRLSNGKIQVETKEEMKKRGLPSPDDADAVMLAFVDPHYRQIVQPSKKRR